MKRKSQPESLQDEASCAEITSLASRCVHCGFCLAACPTYAVTRAENDSPRGRILLLAEAAARNTFDSATLRYHFDRCIGCEACVPACPSGVRYDELLDLAWVVINRGRSESDRRFRASIFALFPYRRRVMVLSQIGAALPRKLIGSLLSIFGRDTSVSRRLEALVTQAPLSVPPRSTNPVRLVAQPQRGQVGLLRGCIASVYLPETNDDAKWVLSAEGIGVVEPLAQGCCGALSWHGGRLNEARRMASQLIDAFDGLECDAIVVTSAGCGSAMKRYKELFVDDQRLGLAADAFSAKVRDVTEYLGTLEPRARRGEYAKRVFYHDACHLRFAQGVVEEPRRLLSEIPGVDLVTSDAIGCCGSGGLYSLEEVELAAAVGELKRISITDLHPDIVASANPGCTLQLRRLLGPDVEVTHPVSIVRASIDAGIGHSLADES
ncbi:MAG: (Fe-S)-binding protein [Ferrimicrobium sp.]